MSCTEMESSVVEILARKVEAKIEWWHRFEDLISLMKELVEAKNDASLSREDRSAIFSLGGRVERRIIALAQRETDDYVKSFERDDNVNPMHLRWQRDNLREIADNAPTVNLRKALRACADSIQEALNRGSERLAEYVISNIEGSVSYAEEILTDDSEFGDRDLRAARANIEDADTALRNCEKAVPPHVRYVGLPRVAKKRGLSVRELYDVIKKRINEASHAFILLLPQVEKNYRQNYERAQVLAQQECKEAEERAAQVRREQCEKDIEQDVATIERRNKQAGQAARQFLEHVKLGNAGGAWASLNEIRRYDGGIPPVLQKEYQRISQ